MSTPYPLRNHVRHHRRRHGDMTQEDLGRLAGVTRQTIISIERGRYNPSVGLALRLARVLAVPVEDLFELQEDEHE